MGVTTSEFAVLNAAGYSLGDSTCDGLFCKRGVHEKKENDQTVLSNVFFQELSDNQWSEYTFRTTYRKKLYISSDGVAFMFSSDLMFKNDAELSSAAKLYVDDNDRFLTDFASAWTKLSNADRFDGPAGNICS